MQPIIKHSYSATIALGSLSVGKQINFQYIPELGEAFIYSIEVYTIGAINSMPDNNNSIVALGASCLTASFAEGDDYFIFNYPVYLLQPIDINNNSQQGYSVMIKPRKINLPKSYITINSTAFLNAPNLERVFFNFIYAYQ
jgi:hypothetical protein